MQAWMDEDFLGEPDGEGAAAIHLLQGSAALRARVIRDASGPLVAALEGAGLPGAEDEAVEAALRSESLDGCAGEGCAVSLRQLSAGLTRAGGEEEPPSRAAVAVSADGTVLTGGDGGPAGTGSAGTRFIAVGADGTMQF